MGLLEMRRTPGLREGELPKIHEAGGLGVNNWRTIDAKLRASGAQDPVAQKLHAYAAGVISGEIQDREFTTRDYLGRRHWNRVAYLFSEGQKFKGGIVNHQTKLQSANDILLYAQLEAAGVYTLSDYIAEEAPKRFPPEITETTGDLVWTFHPRNRTTKELVWDGKAREYHIEVTESAEMLEWPSGGDPQHDNYELTDFKELSRTPHPATDSEPLLSKWLLDPSDVEDPFHTSPDEYRQLLLNKAAHEPDVVRERLREAYLKKMKTTKDSISIFMTTGKLPEWRKQPLASHLQKAYQNHFGVRPDISEGILGLQGLSAGFELSGERIAEGSTARLDERPRITFTLQEKEL